MNRSEAFTDRLMDTVAVYRAVFIAAVISVLLSGCNTLRPVLPDALSVKPVSGVLQRVEEQLWFQPCFERLWWPVNDYTQTAELQRLYERFAGPGTLPVYIEADAVVDPAQGHRMLISRIKVAGGTASTCSYRIDGVAFRAASESPYWIADIAEDSVVVKSTNPLGRYSFLVTATEDEAGVIYRETTAVAQPFSIRLTEQRCEESSNGTVLNYAARMVLFGHPYQGCARRGHSGETQLHGYYWYSPGGTDQVVMNLGDDQRVQLVYKTPGGRVTTVRGHWQFLESGKLILSMKHRNGKEFLALFRRQDSGAFTLQGNAFEWAPAQADFQHWQPSGLPGGRALPGQDTEQVPDNDGVQVITLPSFAAPTAQADGEQLTPIRVTECEPQAPSDAC